MIRTTLLAAAAFGLLASGTALAQRDGTPGNPPSTATQRALDAVTGDRTRPDGTPGNPPGTAAERALDRAAGTNTSGAFPSQSDGMPGNPPGTAAGRAIDGALGTGSTGSTSPATGGGTVR